MQTRGDNWEASIKNKQLKKKSEKRRLEKQYETFLMLWGGDRFYRINPGKLLCNQRNKNKTNNNLQEKNIRKKKQRISAKSSTPSKIIFQKSEGKMKTSLI